MSYQNKKLLKLFGWVALAAVVFTILPGFVFISLMAMIQLLFWVGLLFFLYQIFGRRYLDKYRWNRKYKKNKPQSFYSDRR